MKLTICMDTDTNVYLFCVFFLSFFVVVVDVVVLLFVVVFR